MRTISKRLISPSCRWGRAAFAGVFATVVYTIAMEGDMALTGNRFNDIRFIQGIISGNESQKKRYSILAWAIHLLNGAILGEIYAAILKRFLPGPNWLKGAIFGELFILSVWWLSPIADKHHPMIKSGELPKLTTRISFLQNVVRHFIFGITLGLVYRNQKS